MKYASLNMNFDSIRECLKLSGYGLNSNMRDIAFFDVMDRFLEISDEYGFKFSIFVIGKDLERKENYNAVRRWSDLGHEIGNHSYSHHQNLAELPPEVIYKEISNSHKIISECTGVEPQGFIAPAWSYSPVIADILLSLNYSYDTSLFPSFLMPIVQLKVRWNSNAKNAIPIIRKDLFGSFFGQRNPFFSSINDPYRNKKPIGKLLMMPLPTTRKRIPMWHTMSFMMKEKRFEYSLKNSINHCKAFYYLLHPVDLVDPERDLCLLPDSICNTERIKISLDNKLYLLKKSIGIIKKFCSLVKMVELASITKKDIVVQSG